MSDAARQREVESSLSLSLSPSQGGDLMLSLGRVVTLEQIGGPVSEIEEQKHEGESDTRDEVNPGGAFRSAGEPTFR